MLVLLILLFLGFRIWQLMSRWQTRDRTWWLGLVTVLIGVAALLGVAFADAIEAKVLAILIMPLGLVWLSLAGLAISQWLARRRILASLLTLVFLLYSAAGNGWIAAMLLGHLEGQTTSIDPMTSASFDAICVLGGGSTRTAEDQPELGDSGDRLLLAAAFYHAGKTPLLVCSGTAIPRIEGEDCDLAQQTRRLWLSIGIPDQAILALPPGPINTRQELAAYKDLIAAKGWHRVGLLSSAWHLPRARHLALAIGLDLIPIPADSRSRMPPFSSFWLIPEDSAFRNTTIACREYLGLLAGR